MADAATSTGFPRPRHSGRLRCSTRIVARRLNGYLESQPWLVLIVGLLLCALVVFLRKPSAFTHPQFWAEDGPVWFEPAYNGGFWSTLLQSYSGTLGLFGRLIAYLATLAPLSAAPRVFSLGALFVQLLPVFLLCSSRLRPIVKSAVVALLVAVIYESLPNSSDEVFVNLANVQWHLGVTAFLLLVAEPPSTRAWKAFDVTCLAICGLTGPFSLLLTIIAGVIYFIRRTHASRLNLCVIAAAAVAQLISLLASGERHLYPVTSLMSPVKMVAGQIFMGSVLGQNNVDKYYGSPLLFVILAAGLLIIAYAIVRGPDWLAMANLFAALVFVSALMSLTPVPGNDVWGVLTQPGAGHRYWFIPIFAWLATLLWIALGSRAIFMRLVAGLLLAGTMLLAIPASWAIPAQPNRHFSHYAKLLDAAPAGAEVVVPINPTGWNMMLVKR